MNTKPKPKPKTLWEIEEPVSELGVEVPPWIDSEIDGATIAAIVQGGCASGAYMPAVTYHEARETMNEYGDEVTEYISLWADPIEYDPHEDTWSVLCVRILSIAVETWADEVAVDLRDRLDLEE